MSSGAGTKNEEKIVCRIKYTFVPERVKVKEEKVIFMMMFKKKP